MEWKIGIFWKFIIVKISNYKSLHTISFHYFDPKNQFFFFLEAYFTNHKNSSQQQEVLGLIGSLLSECEKMAVFRDGQNNHPPQSSGSAEKVSRGEKSSANEL